MGTKQSSRKQMEALRSLPRGTMITIRREEVTWHAILSIPKHRGGVDTITTDAASILNLIKRLATRVHRKATP